MSKPATKSKAVSRAKAATRVQTPTKAKPATKTQVATKLKTTSKAKQPVKTHAPVKVHATAQAHAPAPAKPQAVSKPRVVPHSKSSWSQKLDQDKGYPKVAPIGPTMSKQWGEGTYVVPAPREVDTIMKSVPSGKLITIKEIRAIVAERHGATIGCPLTVGIFAWIAAHAAEDELRAKKRGATPYWRTLKSGGYLNEKYPGGIVAHKEKLEAEGHDIIERGQKLAVADYERYLVESDETD